MYKLVDLIFAPLREITIFLLSFNSTSCPSRMSIICTSISSTFNHHINYTYELLKKINFQFKDIVTINKILSQTLNSTQQENNMQLVTLFKALKHER